MVEYLGRYRQYLTTLDTLDRLYGTADKGHSAHEPHDNLPLVEELLTQTANYLKSFSYPVPQIPSRSMVWRH